MLQDTSVVWLLASLSAVALHLLSVAQAIARVRACAILLRETGAWLGEAFCIRIPEDQAMTAMQHALKKLQIPACSGSDQIRSDQIRPDAGHQPAQ